MKVITPAVLMALVILIAVTPALATNGYQLTGVGEVETSLGGAVTGNPVDSMTAITNPAGMARIGRRADFSLQAFLPTRSVDFGDTGGGSTEGGSKLYGIPSIGWTAPALGRDDVWFGGGMFVTSGLGVDYDQTIFMPGMALGPGVQDVTFSGFSSIQFWKMAPTMAWNVNPAFSVGLSLNLDYQSVTIQETIRNVPFWNNPADHSKGFTQRDVNLDLGRPTSQMGFGATIGLLYDVAPWITVGAMYSSKQSFGDSEYRVGSGDVQYFNGAMGLPGTYSMNLDYPQQAAFGLGLRPLKDLTVSLDVKWINWSSTHDKVDFSGPAGAFDTNGDGVGDASATSLDFGWKDQWVYAIGLQYTVTPGLTLRAGYNYAKSPIDEADVFNNLVFPAVVEHHISAGVGYMLGDHWGLSLTYMKALKKTLTGTGDVPAGFQATTPFPADSNAEISLEEDSVGVQLTYRF